ncbi:hypothetical protein GW571_12860 [Clavibacter capsici]|uniref:hypothetical protein n=1 Tax=Clavibacter capsici TaxID=1874630 RepID=UPI00142833AE|nr:hypothetical protein [Clavibacter capsici]QIS42957.1 hypothetical protein GW571_12860 [Clavibacter capsici]
MNKAQFLLNLASSNPDALRESWLHAARRQRRLLSLDLSTFTERELLLAVKIPTVDAAIASAGVIWKDRASHSYSESAWDLHIQAETDQVVDILIQSQRGNWVGAIIRCRSLLERWTRNVAHNQKITKVPDETWADYCSRTWDTYGTTVAESRMGTAWSLLSELLHGRPTSLGSQSRPLLLSGLTTTDKEELRNYLADMAAVSLFQIGVTAVELLSGETREHYARLLINGGASISDLDVVRAMMPHYPRALEPLLPSAYGAEQPSRDLITWSTFYELQVTSDSVRANLLEKKYSGFHVGPAMCERLERRLNRAHEAFLSEQKMIPETFDPQSLEIEYFLWEAIETSSTQLGANHATGPSWAPLMCALNALRSARFLWLEDDHMSLACLRTAIEQLARARCHRIKPVAAERIESRGSAASPRDWIEKSGWGRLASLNRALGQFAHRQRLDDWEDGFDALVELQGTGDHPQHTARGNTLRRTYQLYSSELAAQAQLVSPEYGSAYRNAFVGNDEDYDASVEEWLNHLMQTGRDMKQAT